MSGAAAVSANPVEEPLASLLAHPAHFEFTRAIAILQRSAPDAVPLGFLGPPDREAIRLRPSLELSFANADIASIEAMAPGAAGPRHRMETNFFGLYGTASPLPAYFTEMLFNQEEPSPVRDFIDIFHHRLLSLAYRVMTKYRVMDDPSYQRRMLTLIGVQSPAEDGDTAAGAADAIPPRTLLACAGLLSQQPRSAAALQRVLSFWLEAPVQVEQCVPRWIDLPRDRQVTLGLGNCSLGVDAVAGERIYDRATSFRIRVGPVGSDAFAALLPTGPAHATLHALVEEFNTACLDYDVDVLVPASALPRAQLGGSARLGWDTCLPASTDPTLSIRFASPSPS